MRLKDPRGVIGFVLLGLNLGACQAIAGIEDRRLDPDAATVPATAQCKQYCTEVMGTCTGKNAVYTSEAHCLRVCAELEPGDPNEPGRGNTVACRMRQVALAKPEPDVSCRSAGPGGDGECGTDCEAYCTLFPAICPDDYVYGAKENCLKACNGLTDQSSYNLDADHGGDTIECRLVHTASATVDPVGHCPHAPVVLPKEWCVGAPKDAPTCAQYCKMQLAACDGTLTQYESEQQCLDVCDALPPGNNADTTGNTVGCRLYHSFSSTIGPDQHCPHAGPTGDGHCGDKSLVADGSTGNCESYCLLLEAACKPEFDTAMGNQKDCMAACIQIDEAEPESRYTIAKAKKSKALQCRTLNSARAFADPTACAAAVGGTPCTG